MNSELENQSVASNDSRSKRSTLRIYYVNVCGLKSKLHCPDFIDVLNEYDIVCFAETKTDRADIPIIDIPGFICYIKNRTDLTIRRSGGIAIYVKQELSPFVHLIDSPCLAVLWMSCNGSVLNLQQNILIGAIYIPPESSKYSSPDIFLQIEQDILSHSVDYPYLAIIGDANSRTGILPDFIDIMDDELDVDLIANDINLLDTLNIPRVRKACDTQRNNFGVELLNLCKNTN